MLPPLPRCSSWVSSSLISPRRVSLPRFHCRVGLHIDLFEVCSAFTHVAACTLAQSPYFVTAIRRLQTFRLLHACSGCFRRERIAGWGLHPLKSAALSRRTWKPVGWAAAGAALMLATGVAATTASAVQLGASYGGVTSPETDEQMNRAVSATLGYSSVGGVLGGVFGTVVADDPQVGFEEDALWGGLAEGAGGLATSLPGALRAVPGLWRAGLPWAKSLLLTPL